MLQVSLYSLNQTSLNLDWWRWDANVHPMELIDPKAGFLDATCYWPVHAIALLICSHEKRSEKLTRPVTNQALPRWSAGKVFAPKCHKLEIWVGRERLKMWQCHGGVATTRGYSTVRCIEPSSSSRWFDDWYLFFWYHSDVFSVLCLYALATFEKKTWGLDQPAVRWAGKFRLRRFHRSYQIKPQKYIKIIQNN